MTNEEDAMVDVKEKNSVEEEESKGEGEELRREKNKDFGVDGVAAGFSSQRWKMAATARYGT